MKIATIEKDPVITTRIRKLKVYLKSKAKEIREKKTKIKDGMREGLEVGRYQWTLYGKDKPDFRHHHIAYCELRGRTREQIEPKTDNPPVEKTIQKIRSEF